MRLPRRSVIEGLKVLSRYMPPLLCMNLLSSFMHIGIHNIFSFDIERERVLI